MQYIIQESNKEKRREFITYIDKTYRLKRHMTKRYMMKSNFPLIVDFNKKDFWVCESITCCACASQANKIITIDQFLKNNITP